MPPIKITKVEGFIIRHPKDDSPETDHIVMPPIGATTGGVGLWNRVDQATPSRSKQYQQFLLVKISTDQGISGWGEGHAPAAPRVHRTVVSDLLEPILVGKDATDVQVLWEKMYSSQRLRGYATGFYMESIAAVDLALWDIRGKTVGLPVARLLGGEYRDRVPTYMWLHGSSPETYAASARQTLGRGYRVMKMSLDFRVDLECVIAVSEVLKESGAQIIVDSLGAFKLYEAVEVGRQLDALKNVGWWEDPLMPEDNSGYTRLCDELDTPICKGEVLSNRFQMRDLCSARAMDISNIDVCRAGGITESQRMAMIADVFSILWTPHVSMGSAAYMAASIHLGAATQNCLIMEDQDQHVGPFGNILLKEPLVYGAGYAMVPDRPGLGVEFNEEELKKIVIA